MSENCVSGIAARDCRVPHLRCAFNACILLNGTACYPCLRARPTRSPRRYTRLPNITYPLHDRDVIGIACGRICMHRKRINVSTVLAGQRVGIKEVDEGIWIVSFMHYDLGYIDLEQKALQPLDNPFGARLLPMS